MAKTKKETKGQTVIYKTSKLLLANTADFFRMIRYFGITFIRYAYNQKIGNQNNIKVFEI